MSATDPRIGTSIGGYRIESILGRGGMSVVYLAEHERLKRKAALKVLSPELAGDETFRRRFVAEWERLAGLDHPNIIPIFEAGEAEGLLYIAMRYVETTDLKGTIRAEGRLEPARAMAIATQVASALDAAHAHSLVHRDVKPGNVLIAPGAGFEGIDHAYLSDFGLTKRTDSVSGLTKTGSFMGTIDYVAPEQITGQAVDGRADQYALACVLFESLTGQVPFPREEETAALFAHLQAPPPRASEVNPTLPPAIDDVIARGMAKEPSERFGTCMEFARAARGALGLEHTAPARVPRLEETVVAAAPELPPTPSKVVPPAEPAGSRAEPPAPDRGPNRVPVIIVTLAALVALVAFGLSQLGGGEEPPPPSPTEEPSEEPVTGPTAAVIFEDPFDDPSTGWETSPEFGVQREYTPEGTYRFTWTDEAPPEQFATSQGGVAGADGDLTDVRVSVTATLVAVEGRQEVGVSCRTREDTTYYLYATSDGFWEIAKIFDVEKFDRLNGGAMEPVAEGSTYRIEGTCVGGEGGGPVTLTLFLDGQELGSAVDEDDPNPRHGEPIPSGLVGIFSQANTGTVTEFDDFVVEDLTG
ncbi:MAG TPA: serine/threonine-protein kinase [Actinomycetota bacterium]|nr:serine/threonine-protein kinase [Actinomycetota bacterium]